MIDSALDLLGVQIDVIEFDDWMSLNLLHIEPGALITAYVDTDELQDGGLNVQTHTCQKNIQTDRKGGACAKLAQ